MKGKKTGGRRPGSPNRVTVEFRQTIQSLLDDNRENVSAWLERVAAEDAYKALSLLAHLAEFASPKLARTEQTITGPNGGPVDMNFMVRFESPKT